MLNLLLFSLVSYSGTTPIVVIGKKGGNVTLPYTFEDKVIFKITLKHLSKRAITVCNNNECSEQKKSGIILKNLSFNDAGRYNLTVYYDNGQRVLKPNATEYQLQIHESGTESHSAVQHKDGKEHKSGSKKNLNNTKDYRRNHWRSIGALGLSLLALAILILFAGIIKKRQ